ncbi:hypothetical protein L1887_60487 [Cichorium endivia]|nr:hypothetical protein L1887_60487 [Cichorium endivia]
MLGRRMQHIATFAVGHCGKAPSRLWMPVRVIDVRLICELRMQLGLLVEHHHPPTHLDLNCRSTFFASNVVEQRTYRHCTLAVGGLGTTGVQGARCERPCARHLEGRPVGQHRDPKGEPHQRVPIGDGIRARLPTAGELGAHEPERTHGVDARAAAGAVPGGDQGGGCDEPRVCAAVPEERIGGCAVHPTSAACHGTESAAGAVRTSLRFSCGSRPLGRSTAAVPRSLLWTDLCSTRLTALHPWVRATRSWAATMRPCLRLRLRPRSRGYAITLHLDSATHTYVDEFSTSNALAVQKQGTETTLVVPESTSILRSVTKLSVVEIAEKLCGWKVELRQVAFDELKQNRFGELMAAGTAAGITPVRSLSYNSHKPQLQHEKLSPEGPKYTLPAENEVERIEFGDGKTAGECARRLFDELTSYQCGDQEDKFGWLWPAEGLVAEDANLPSN